MRRWQIASVRGEVVPGHDGHVVQNTDRWTVTGWIDSVEVVNDLS
jgi:hypothetical protein